LRLRSLEYAYTRKGVTTIYVKDENQQDLIAQINYVTIYNNERYFRTYSGTFITIPYPDDPTQSYLEILSMKARDRKYYMIDRFDRIGMGAGTYNIKLAPRDEIIVYMDVTITNDIISKLMSIPGLNYVTSFLINLGINMLNFGLVIGNYIRELLGLKDYYVVKAEKINDNPLVIRFYYRTDIAPILAVIILGSIICGTIITWIIATAIRDMRVAEMTYETQKVITERYIQYTKLVDKVIDFCQTQPDPQKCYNEIIPTITQPNTGSDEAKDTQDDLMKTIEMLKQFLLIAVVIGVVLAVISYLRK
jgi:Fe-S-cluster formation regulator IscX/YfhJ